MERNVENEKICASKKYVKKKEKLSRRRIKENRKNVHKQRAEKFLSENKVK